MGDVSAEPSMEDILSSIKRIIADEGGEPAPIRARRAARPPRPIEPAAELEPFDDEPDAEVLELNEPLAEPPPPPAQTAPAPMLPPVEAPMPSKPAPTATAAPPAEEPIVSRAAAAATRGSLDTLSRMLVKPEPTGDGTLEGLVREMLRPMLRDWLDANLPPMVEGIVEREIAKIIGAPR